MKIASKKPVAIRTNVYVTHDIYEAWYAKPVSLGRIQKKGDYWFTIDGHRHVSSRDALNYLIRMQDPSTNQEAAPEQVEQKPTPVPQKKVVAKKVSEPVERRSEHLEPVNQQHPRFQEFLDFLNYQARRKMHAADAIQKL